MTFLPQVDIPLDCAGIMDNGQIETRKETARAWFETLRDQITAAFEAVEDALPAGGAACRSRAGPIQAHAVEPHRP